MIEMCNFEKEKNNSNQGTFFICYNAWTKHEIISNPNKNRKAKTEKWNFPRIILKINEINYPFKWKYIMKIITKMGKMLFNFKNKVWIAQAKQNISFWMIIFVL